MSMQSGWQRRKFFQYILVTIGVTFAVVGSAAFARAQVANLRAALARVVELARELVDGGRWQHGSARFFEEGVQRAVLSVENFGADIDLQCHAQVHRCH